VRDIGILSVGMKLFKTAVHGTVKYVENAEIGGNGIVRIVIDAHMV
jgi:hypothetical protein